MGVLRPRTRLVYFRVSEDEFSQLASVCHTQGLRSISEVARSAVKRMLDHELPQDESDHRQLIQLSDSVAEISRTLKSLVTLVRDHGSKDISSTVSRKHKNAAEQNSDWDSE